MIVRETLTALSIHDVAAAKALETEWLADPEANDFRTAGAHDVARWIITRELLGVAGELPARVLRHIALGIQADDLAGAKPALDMYRAAYPKQAGRAHSLMHLRAPNIFKQIEGSLWRAKDASPEMKKVVSDLNDMAKRMASGAVPPVPPPPRPPAFTAPPPPKNAGRAFGGLGAIALCLLAAIRVCAQESSHRSSYLDYPNLNIPNYKLDPKIFDVPTVPQVDYSALGRLNLGMPIPLSDDETPAGSKEFLLSSLDALSQPMNAASSEYAVALLRYRKTVMADDCKLMIKAEKTIDWPDAPPAQLPSLEVMQHLDTMHVRIHRLCTTDGKPKPKPKTPKPKAK
jgi:hypothetical protein